MNLYFQIFTQDQSARALQLMQFIAFVSRSDRPIAGTAKMLTGPTISSFKFSSLDELIKKSSKKKFNELELKCILEPINLNLVRSSQVLATGLFKPAPSNPVWFHSSKWPMGGDSSVRNRKMNARTAEAVLLHNQVQKPSLFELVLEVDTTLSSDIVLDKVSELLTSELQVPLHQIEPFGCCDLGGREFFVRLESNVLMTEHIRIMANIPARDYPKLGLRFDQLHPLMFGNRKLCDEIGSALGEDAKVIYGEGITTWGIIKLSSACDLKLANMRASKWLLKEYI